jgi:hypothetical protein
VSNIGSSAGEAGRQPGWRAAVWLCSLLSCLAAAPYCHPPCCVPLHTACHPPAHPPPWLCPAPCRHDQPYQIALYNLGVLCEAKRWHVADYEAVLPGITAEQLQVGGSKGVSSQAATPGRPAIGTLEQSVAAGQLVRQATNRAPLPFPLCAGFLPPSLQPLPGRGVCRRQHERRRSGAVCTAAGGAASAAVLRAASLCLSSQRTARGVPGRRPPRAAHPAGAQPSKRQLCGSGVLPGKQHVVGWLLLVSEEQIACMPCWLAAWQPGTLQPSCPRPKLTCQLSTCPAFDSTPPRLPACLPAGGT